MPDVDLIDDQYPEDPSNKYDKMTRKIKGYVQIQKQMGKRDFRKDVQGNENRFQVIHDISEWNAKYGSKIGFSFAKGERNTDIPGTKHKPDP